MCPICSHFWSIVDISQKVSLSSGKKLFLAETDQSSWTPVRPAHSPARVEPPVAFSSFIFLQRHSLAKRHAEWMVPGPEGCHLLLVKSNIWPIQIVRSTEQGRLPYTGTRVCPHSIGLLLWPLHDQRNGSCRGSSSWRLAVPILPSRKQHRISVPSLPP